MITHQSFFVIFARVTVGQNNELRALQLSICFHIYNDSG